MGVLLYFWIRNSLPHHEIIYNNQEIGVIPKLVPQRNIGVNIWTRENREDSNCQVLWYGGLTWRNNVSKSAIQLVTRALSFTWGKDDMEDWKGKERPMKFDIDARTWYPEAQKLHRYYRHWQWAQRPADYKMMHEQKSAWLRYRRTTCNGERHHPVGWPSSKVQDVCDVCACPMLLKFVCMHAQAVKCMQAYVCTGVCLYVFISYFYIIIYYYLYIWI